MVNQIGEKVLIYQKLPRVVSGKSEADNKEEIKEVLIAEAVVSHTESLGVFLSIKKITNRWSYGSREVAVPIRVANYRNFIVREKY